MDRWNVFEPATWVTIEASYAPGTQKSYGRVFKQFEAFLADVGRTIENVRLSDVLTFMQEYVEAKSAASTMRYVSASLHHYFRLHRQEQVLSSYLVRLFVQGAQKLAPPPQKKTVIWDPEIPMRFIAGKPRPKDFLNAGREALLLLLLATGIRVDCASKLSSQVPTGGEYCRIPFLLPRKTGNSEPQVLKPFPENERLCPVKAIRHYLSLAKRIRATGEKFLFVSSRGKKAHIDTLRHWVVDLLEESGVKASAGSCRSAATSSAFLRSIPIDVILRSAGWARENTFRRYYQRQVLSEIICENLMPSIAETRLPDGIHNNW